MIDAQRQSLTICALASGAGHGAISVIRLSGKNALEIIQKSCKLPTHLQSHHVHLVNFKNLNQELVDQVILTYFEYQKSYTGETTFEISCHGSPFVVQTIINTLIDNGASNALPGEFTYRAFLNGKLDLIQAEAVLSLIESNSTFSHRQSLNQLSGKSSKAFLKFEDVLIWCLAHIEASIDFSTEDIQVVDSSDLIHKLSLVLSDLNKLVDSFQTSRLLKSGIKLTLLGQPNVGKSSLLNNLLNEDRAIVTNTPGTTRDIVSETVHFGGFVFNLSDTAGLRETENIVEKIGIAKTIEIAEKSDFLIYVLDASDFILSDEQIEFINSLNIPTLFVLNKKDISSLNEPIVLKDGFLVDKFNKQLNLLRINLKQIDVISVSSFNLDTQSEIFNKVIHNLNIHNLTDHTIFISSRQHEYAQQAINNISVCINELKNNVDFEYIAQTLKLGLLDIQMILGHVYDDQVMDRVFKEFCLGK